MEKTDLRLVPRELRVFQVGVQIEQTRTTDLLVRVRAADEAEARRLARQEVANRCNGHDGCPLDVPTDVDWVEEDLREAGDSDTDYSDMSVRWYPDADIDLTGGSGA